MPTPPDELPPLLSEHEQLVRELLSLLKRMAACTEVPELIEQTADGVLRQLMDWGVPSWQAGPVLAQALIMMCEPGLARSEAQRARGLTSPEDPNLADPTN